VLARIQAIRYVTPLREGGSLPGVVEADDLGTYVAKFRGAGQGRRALVAEVIVTELARSLGIRVPDLRVVQLDETIARYEADEEVQDLLKASVGLNLAVDFLPGAFGFDASSRIDPAAAGTIVWLDAYTANVDRTWRNPNLLVWHRRLWAIDHGAALYFHHSWSRGIGPPERFAQQPYDVSRHVLSAYLPYVGAADAELAPLLTRDLLVEVVDQVPDAWIEVPAPAVDHAADQTADQAAGTALVREAYVDFLLARASGERSWLPQASAA
jgi:hypothetical protein